MKKADIEAITGALDEAMEGWGQYYNIKTGEIESCPEDTAYFGGAEFEENLHRFRRSGNYIRLPDQNEIHEYRIMEEFAEKSGRTELLTALHQKHPYRKFKDAINRLDIADLYYDFRTYAYYEIAKEWCQRHGLFYTDSLKKYAAESKEKIFSSERLKNGINADTIQPGRYRHYKGNEYEVMCLAKHSETEELMVVYKALYGEGQVWVRPASMWNEPVTTKEGNKLKRFTYIGEE